MTPDQAAQLQSMYDASVDPLGTSHLLLGQVEFLGWLLSFGILWFVVWSVVNLALNRPRHQ